MSRTRTDERTSTRDAAPWRHLRDTLLREAWDTAVAAWRQLAAPAENGARPLGAGADTLAQLERALDVLEDADMHTLGETVYSTPEGHMTWGTYMGSARHLPGAATRGGAR